MGSRILSIPALLLVCAVPLVATAAATDSEMSNEEMAKLPRARVSFLEGDLSIYPAGQGESIEVSLNTVLRPGDRLETGTGSFVEAEATTTFLRLAGSTMVDVEELEPRLVVSLLRGGAYVSRGPQAAPASVVVADSRIALDADSMVRVDVEAPDRFVVYVARGRAEALTPQESVLLDASDILTVSGGTPRKGRWSGRDDAFDRWNREREQRVRAAKPKYLSGNYEGAYALEGYGEWIYTSGRWCWRPFVSASWRPYWDGYWAWRPPYGWVWVSYQPWGYLTHHYGRWHYSYEYGWVWMPGAVWAPAWVAWGYWGGYVGWCPVDYYGRPVVVYAGYGYYDPYSWCFWQPSYFYYGGGYYYYEYDHDYTYDGHHHHHHHGDDYTATGSREGGGAGGTRPPALTLGPDAFKTKAPVRLTSPGQALMPRSALDKKFRANNTTGVVGDHFLADMVRKSKATPPTGALKVAPPQPHRSGLDPSRPTKSGASLSPRSGGRNSSSPGSPTFQPDRTTPTSPRVPDAGTPPVRSNPPLVTPPRTDAPKTSPPIRSNPPTHSEPPKSSPPVRSQPPSQPSQPSRVSPPSSSPPKSSSPSRTSPSKSSPSKSSPSKGSSKGSGSKSSGDKGGSKGGGSKRPHRHL